MAILAILAISTVWSVKPPDGDRVGSEAIGNHPEFELGWVAQPLGVAATVGDDQRCCRPRWRPPSCRQDGAVAGVPFGRQGELFAGYAGGIRPQLRSIRALRGSRKPRIVLTAARIVRETMHGNDAGLYSA